MATNWNGHISKWTRTEIATNQKAADWIGHKPKRYQPEILWWNMNLICCATYRVYKPTFKLMPQTFSKKVWKTFQRHRLDCDETQIVSCYLPDLYTRFQVHISTQLSRKKLRKFSGGVEFCWGPLSENCPAMTKSSTVQNTCHASVCAKSKGSIQFLRP